MSVSFQGGLPILIASGQSSSPAYSSESYADAASMMLYSPAGLAESVKIQVHYRLDALAADAGWCDLTDYTGASVAAPAASQARWYPELCAAAAFKLVAASNVAADRTFYFIKSFTA